MRTGGTIGQAGSIYFVLYYENGILWIGERKKGEAV